MLSAVNEFMHTFFFVILLNHHQMKIVSINLCRQCLVTSICSIKTEFIHIFSTIHWIHLCKCSLSMFVSICHDLIIAEILAIEANANFALRTIARNEQLNNTRESNFWSIFFMNIQSSNKFIFRRLWIWKTH